MVNCNPETVSTDYDTSDRLYFEPLTAEDVHNVIAAETAAAGGVAPKVIVALGGQTPLKLAAEIPPELVAGTTAESIDAAEDREKWNRLCHDLGIPQPPGGTAVDLDQALAVAGDVGYPVLVRPSYVLGGRAMRIVHDEGQLREAMDELAGHGSLGREGGLSADRPVLIDRFLDDAVEVDVDAVRDRAGEVLIGGVMEHVEEAGRAFGGLGVRDPAAVATAVGDRGDQGLHGGDRRPPRRARLAQRAVRRARDDGVRDRGQSPGEPNGAVRFQGDGCSARQGGDARDARGDARRAARRGAAATVGARRRDGVDGSWPSRRPCCRSRDSPTSTRRSVRRCARPAR